MNGPRKLLTLAALCLSAALPVLAGCSGRLGLDAKHEADPFEDALASLKLPAKEKFSGAPDLGTVMVVGENHASVETQRQIADLIESLRKTGACDLVLIEGSNGEVTADKVPVPPGAQAWRNDGEYWRPQLEEGRLAGYEFAKLVDRALPVIGVEDMTEKARFAVQNVERPDRDVRETVDAYRRAYEFLENVYGRLIPAGQKAPNADARALLDAYKSSLDRCTQLAGSYSSAVEPRVEVMKTVISAVADADRQREKIGDKALLAAAEVAEKAQPLQDALNSLIDKRDKEFQRAKGLFDKNPNDPKLPAIVKKLKEWDGDIERKSTELEILVRPLKTLETEHAGELAALKRSNEQLKKGEEQLQSLAEKEGPLLKKVDTALSELRDACYSASNAMLDMAGDTSADAGKIRGFFAEDIRQRREKSRKEIGVAELKPRDEAMVKNTVAALRSHKAKRAVLIVGYAHMEGITAGLKAANCSFVASVPPSSLKDIEPWEQAAWDSRREVRAPLAERDRVGRKKIKELSQLLNPRWIAEQKRQQELFTSLGKSTPTLTELAGGGKTYDAIAGPGTVMRVSKLPLDRNAKRSAYVLAAGRVPGSANEYFEIVDRQLGRLLVDKLSDKQNVFVYQQVTAEGGRKKTTFYVEGKEVSFQDFAATAPGGGEMPRRVILFGEDDLVEENGGIVSPVWRRLRTAESGGGPPNKPPTWTSLFAPAPEPGGRRPSVLRTTNPERAKRNAEVLDMQRPTKQLDVTVVTEADLGNLEQHLGYFTPRTGEHAHVVTIVAKNTAEFRAAIKRAAEAGLLENKQVALITCGDAFTATAELRELLLQSRAVMVWTPSRQLTPEAGKELASRAKQAAASLQLAGIPVDMDMLMNEAIRSWNKDKPDDAQLRPVLDAGSWVRQPDEDARSSGA